MYKLILFFFCLPAAAQLIPAGAAIPKGTQPPVIFLNGYENSCTGSQFSGTFGQFDQFLQAAGRTAIFFDNCAYPGKPPIESLGSSFGTFLAGLKYTDGTSVSQVDVVSHSLGGLIVRAYLAGMQADSTFNPPIVQPIRKAIFLSTPHFGTGVGQLLGSDVQTAEISTGSTFVYSLGTYNQGTDDLRGIDALTVAGNGGTAQSNGASEGDGVVNLTSSSIEFAEPQRTRILPYCHIPYSALLALLQSAGPGFALLAPSVCPVNAPGIAFGANATDTNVTMVVSFLNSTPDWQTIGTSAAQNSLLSTQAGVILRAQSAMGQYLNIASSSVGSVNLSGYNNMVTYNEFLAKGTQPAIVNTSSGQLNQTVNVVAGYTNALLIKAGPQIARIFPAAAALSPLSVAPGTFISIYGTNLAPSTTQASTTPLPTMLTGTQVLFNGVAIPLQIVTPNQINAILPVAGVSSGTLMVSSPNGQHTVNLLEVAAVPALFTQNGAGTGLASVLNAVTNVPISAGAPLHAGDYAAIYLTGLGAKSTAGLALIQPTVTIAGQNCPVQYGGVAPGFAGLDQINCQIPAGLGTNAAAALVVTSNGRVSNSATLILQ